MSEGFRRLELPAEPSLFAQLYASAAFEQLGKGRQGTVLVEPDPARGTPIVRTTSIYERAAQCFSPLHRRLARQIQALAALPCAFNNALIEAYTNSYARMGLHCDQALDLRPGSSIALFSCYEHPERATPPRALVIESKQDAGERFELALTHHSVVLWSLATNQRFRHKIVLDRSRQPPENRWLGLTFRTSATFVRTDQGQPRFESGAPLGLADEQQRKAFYQLRGRENRELDFCYPPLDYTISASDLLPPSPARA